MKALTSTVQPRLAHAKKMAALPAFNFSFSQSERQAEMERWGWTPFQFLHFAVMSEHRERRPDPDKNSLRNISRSICYQSFYPDTEEPFYWVIETRDRTFESSALIPPRLYSRPIRECPFELFKGWDKNGFIGTQENLYVPSGWAKEVWEYARWGVTSIAASFETPDPYAGRMLDGKLLPITEQMLFKLGRRTQYK